IIIGGHSHDLIKGISSEKNLIISPKGEPVVITQVGKDGNYLGILDVVFNSDGVIRSAHNNVQKTINFEKDLSIEDIKDKYLGIPEIISYLDHDIRSPEEIAENPLASFVADAIREKSNAQIVMFNNSNVRGILDAGQVTTRDISEILPFNDSLCKILVSERRIIDALNWGAKTTVNKPEYLQTSGLRYTITPQNTVKDVYLENQDGTLTKLNHVNPGLEKKFVVVCKTSYVTDGFLGYKALKVPKGDIIETYTWFQSDVVINYVKKFNNKHLEIELKKRIIVENEPNTESCPELANIFSKKQVAI
ncbi:MAG: bifunctional metallophosphatase/5'-nucleotidase, partial [Candidatus Gastranaerophilales bacterium]|nr:bifunctional metallophosphatase/5'-nucleotidase [Candidatus Gastranaerophilales bacterium]